ncbi:MAG TPA: YibE/F family protein, partial [Spirochaetales bacterium]|nr:YibE/F family protein [Spirochaetales bacterium]
DAARPDLPPADVNPLTMFSMSYVSSEVFHTMVGSLGLVLIAPLTALLSAWLLSSQPSQKGYLR